MELQLSPHAYQFISDLSTLTLPVGMGFFCRFDVKAYQDEMFSSHGVLMPDALARAVPKRRAEYLAGRFLCRRLLSEQGLPTQVGSGRNREPLWPEGWLGSISHCGDMAVAALAPEEPGAYLGLDVEAWMSPKQCHELESSLVQPGELDALSSDWPRERLLTLAFSAKESLFKALYPQVGEYFGFEAARLIRMDAGKGLGGAFSIELRQSLAPSLPAGMVFHGEWRALGGRLLTVLASAGG
ncbi:4'-phosphopantetheinyl transferase [Chromobacterium sp. IIBBL 290-4]|uniref:4'-phosphopantetheinyl transferase family protein n=1 Tax=Chromobacterium sp. IIBBL 290-4 TaxID=2953890 RepID=UPI0020B65355|nr:4'-phosphopantetheinyl transferase superfamily protein [Chromobacterium sp. IIBBL 290-4]UTH74295.1 4'-phosphopantetheinyl transferase superfamily protein [Chromobacterium sp. IIBBL 290-4]